MTPNAETRAALAEYDEMKRHPDRYHRYDSFDDLKNEVLADRVHHFKNEEQGMHNMSKIVEDLCKEYAEAAVKNTTVQIASNLIMSSNLNNEQIADATKLSLQEDQALREKQSA